MQEMTLQEFVKETLIQTAQGTQDAQEAVAKVGGTVNPASMYLASTKTDEIVFLETASGGRPIAAIKFDVALTVTSSSGKKGGLGLFVAGAGIGGQVDSVNQNSSVSRIQFTVPLQLKSN